MREPGIPSPAKRPDAAPVIEYWRARLDQHIHDTYAGLRMSKFPEDLRVYEHLLWAGGVNVVIEIGAQFGGSLLWFRDRVRAFSAYRGGDVKVIGVDIVTLAAESGLAQVDPRWADDIVLIEGSVCDPSLVERVAAHLPADARCLIVEDSAHVSATTRAALEGYTRFIAPGGYFVVEDAVVDIEDLRLTEDWPRGVQPAIDEFLGSDAGAEFVRRTDLEVYGITCHPGGFLQRIPHEQET